MSVGWFLSRKSSSQLATRRWASVIDSSGEYSSSKTLVPLNPKTSFGLRMRIETQPMTVTANADRQERPVCSHHGDRSPAGRETKSRPTKRREGSPSDCAAHRGASLVGPVLEARVRMQVFRVLQHVVKIANRSDAQQRRAPLSRGSSVPNSKRRLAALAFLGLACLWNFFTCAA